MISYIGKRRSSLTYRNSQVPPVTRHKASTSLLPSRNNQHGWIHRSTRLIDAYQGYGTVGFLKKKRGFELRALDYPHQVAVFEWNGVRHRGGFSPQSSIQQRWRRDPFARADRKGKRD